MAKISKKKLKAQAKQTRNGIRKINGIIKGEIFPKKYHFDSFSYDELLDSLSKIVKCEITEYDLLYTKVDPSVKNSVVVFQYGGGKLKSAMMVDDANLMKEPNFTGNPKGIYCVNWV